MRDRRMVTQTVVIAGAYFFLFGAAVGSFLNVCITRIPEEISIIAPRSRCPKCGTPIKAYDNVPVLAWMWLKGRCRACGAPISIMYPLLELATGFFFVAAFAEYGITQATVKWIFFTCFLIVLAITDLRVRLLPDVVTWPGFAAGLVFSAFVPPHDATALTLLLRPFGRLRTAPLWSIGVLEGVLGAAFGSFLLWALATGYRLVRKREGMGMGDVKMIAMVGAFLGLRGTFWTILLGSLLGSVIGLSVVAALYASGWHRKLAERASRRGLGTVRGLRWAIASQYQLPLGTFLGIGALAVVYLGPFLDSARFGLRGILRLG